MAAPNITPYGGPLLASLPEAIRNRLRAFFLYTAEFIPLAAGSTSAQQLSINSDADFALCAISRVGTNTANTTFSANLPILATLTNSGSGRLLSDRAVHLDNYAGTAQLPFILPVPVILTAGSNLTVQLQNLDGANAFNVRVAFHGFKLFI